MVEHNLRQRLFVDAKVQGALLTRLATYWLCCVALMLVVQICWEVISTPGGIHGVRFEQVWNRSAPALAMSLLLLPFILLDAARISNRVVGPIYRLRKSMRELTEGQPTKPLIFRNDDFWKELADEFNALATAVQKTQQTKCAQATVVMDRAELDAITAGAK